MPQCPRKPVVIGLLGGVAAGKTAVAKAFAAHGLEVIDADQLAREVAARPEIRGRLRDRFGPGVFAGGGSLDRDRLASLIFRDEAARKDLEAILHPFIRHSITTDLESALRRGVSVVLDAPLLLEGGLIDRCDICVFVEASPASRRDRARQRGWDEGELEKREAAQAPLSVKKNRCAYTIGSDGPLTEIAQKVAAVLQAIAARSTPRK